MKTATSKAGELFIPGYKPAQCQKAKSLYPAFREALKVTRSYTLTRDVDTLVEAALRREKRND